MSYILRNGVFVLDNFEKLGVQSGYGTKELTIDKLEKLSAKVGRGLAAGVQTHSKNIVVLKKDGSELDEILEKTPYPDSDALITDRDDIILYTKHADCQALFFYDVERKVIGICHSGWKGSFDEISVEMVKKFQEEFASSLENIHIGIGIGISQDVYEVSREFQEDFIGKFSSDVLNYVFIEKNGKIYYDNGLFNKNLLVSYGVKEENICLSDECTYKNTDLHSYRRDKEKSGRNLAYIYLNRNRDRMTRVAEIQEEEGIRKNFLKKKEGVYRVALYISEIFLRSGGETYKVEGMVETLCRSQGIFYANILVTPTFIVIGDDRADGITFIKNIKDRTINLKKVALVNSYYEELIQKQDIDFKEVIISLVKIDNHIEYNEFFRILAAGAGAAMFGALFKIGINEGIMIFFLTVISVYFSSKITKVLKAWILGVISACFLIGIVAFYGAAHGYVESSHKVIIGAILPFLPGVAITKSIIDLVNGDYISGNSRATEALLSAMSIGVGIGLAMNFWVKLGGRI